MLNSNLIVLKFVWEAHYNRTLLAIKSNVKIKINWQSDLKIHMEI